LVNLINSASPRRLDRLANGLTGYLYRVAMNVVKDRFRGERRKSTLEMMKRKGGTERGDLNDPNLLREQVENLISQLPDNFQQYFRLRFLEGYSVEEAAEICGTTVAAAYKREQRGITYLRRRMETYPELAVRIVGPTDS
jgi:RNA polymerase sigma factor (sigma-70 family)